MPQRRHRLSSSTASLIRLASALLVLAVMPNRRRKVRIAPRRLAASLAFATLFFAGAAFSAGAGNEVASLLETGDETAAMAAESTTTSTDELPPAEAPAEGEAPSTPGGAMDEPEEAPAEAAPPSAAAPPAAEPAPAPAESADAELGAAGEAARPHNGASAQSPASRPQGHAQAARPTKPALWKVRARQFNKQPPVLAPQPLALRKPTIAREPEADEPGVAATIWLHRALPDPTPPSRRLTPAFARNLARVSAKHKVDWALVLGVLRASGKRGSAPASTATLNTLSNRLAGFGARRSPWAAVLALRGRTAFADQTMALRHYNRAVGLKALVKGLEWAKPSLSRRILRDKRISIYPGGRSDIELGRVNIRVLALMAYLAEAHGKLTVSCLISGHRLYSRPGVVSAHIYGLAIDISALGGLSVMGNSLPGGITEQAVRNVLLLPAELQPRQVISLLGMGGPSFPMGNHDDHIHVGF